jgi:N-acetylmuramoyl-L-alanine amidase
VPSALLELGYLTNPEDEKQLDSAEWQGRVADAMVGAIDGYFGKGAEASAKP